MDSIVTIVTAATNRNLVTLSRIKAELSISGSGSDYLLKGKIRAASRSIERFVGYSLARETVRETFRPREWRNQPECLSLSRIPVVSITGVTLDGDAVDADEFELDANPGLLYRLDTLGRRWVWYATNSIVVEYPAGYILPDDDGSNLEPDIEEAAVALMRSYWDEGRRDPSLRSEIIPGVREVQYWNGVITSKLPDDVIEKLHPYKRLFT